MNETEKAKKAEKISALLEMAERGATAEERQAFSERAEKLMLQWGIEEAVARAASKGDVKPEEVTMYRFEFAPLKGSSTYWKAWMMTAYEVSRGLGLNGFFNNHGRTFTVVGHESDVERAKVLINSVLVQQAASLDEWWVTEKTNPYLFNYHEKWRAKMDFCASFGSAVGHRLREMNRKIVEETPGASLALRDKDAEIKDAMDALALGKGRSHNHGGSSAGAAAGRAANLGEKGLGGRRALA